MKGTLVGAAVGGTAGAVAPKKPKETRTEKVLRGILLGGLGGSFYDHFKNIDKFTKNYGKSGKGAKGGPTGNFRSISKDLADLGIKDKSKIKTKKEVKLQYRRTAMKHHPDRTGGDDKKMKDANAA